MNKLLKGIAILCLLILSAAGKANAQDSKTTFPKYTLSTKPLLLFDGEYKLSLEMPFKTPQQRIGFGLSGMFLPGRNGDTWFTRTTIDYDNWLKSLKGFGVDLTYKYYFIKSILYVGGDVFYGHYQTKYDDYAFKEFQENGLTFYEREFGPRKKNFDKVALNAYFGVGTPLKNRFFIDTYLGIGCSTSFYNHDGPRFDSIFGFGYKGLYPVMGCRIGFNFGR